MEIFGIDKKLKSISSTSKWFKICKFRFTFEKLLKDNGINPRDLVKIEKEEPELWDKVTKNPGGIRDGVKQLTAKQKKFYEVG